MAIIRKVRDSDLGEISAIHVRSWQTAYRGVLQDELLAEQDAVNREAMWRKTLTKMSGTMLVSACYDDQIVGFSFFDRARDLPDDQPYDGRVYALHVRPDMKWQGIGSQLLLGAFLKLCEMGCRTAIIWTLADLNPPRQFYKYHGGTMVRSKLGDFGGRQIVEVTYGWENLSNGIRD